MAGKGGGSWKVAYADFVTAMMAFFLVMWLSAQKPEVKEAVASYFQDPFADRPEDAQGSGASLFPDHQGGLPTAFFGQRPPADEEGNNRVARRAVAHFQNGPKIQVPHHLDQRALGELVEFPEATAELNDHAKKQLCILLPEILGKPQKIEIRGHANRRPLPPGSRFQDPWHLCYARCVAVMEYLVEQGIEPSRLRLSQAGIHGSRARYSAQALQGEKSGVEIFLLPETVESLPGVVPEALHPPERRIPDGDPIGMQ